MTIEKPALHANYMNHSIAHETIYANYKVTLILQINSSIMYSNVLVLEFKFF